MIQIPEQVEKIIDTLIMHGFEAYAVGGCVRDTLLGKEPEDWDITTSAKPQQVKEIFKRTVDTGIQHGTVTVMMDYTGYEVTTYRIDGEYEDGRHPKSVKFTSNLLEDLKRRDFTINAMAYNHEAGIVDEFGGMEDLKNRVIRCVGNPKDRFMEDALRILRAIRFSAQLGFGIEERTNHAIRQIAPNLLKVSKERIQSELTKLLLSIHPEKIEMIYETGICPYISNHFTKVIQGRPVVSSELPAVKHMRWACFLRYLGEQDAIAVLKDLKMDHDTISKVATLVRLWKQQIPQNKPEIRRLMSCIPGELYNDLINFQKVLGNDIEYLCQVEQLSYEIRESGDCICLKEMAVGGKDLISAGMKPGRELGSLLNYLFDIVLEEPEKNTKDYLLEEAFRRSSHI